MNIFSETGYVHRFRRFESDASHRSVELIIRKSLDEKLLFLSSIKDYGARQSDKAIPHREMNGPFVMS